MVDVLPGAESLSAIGGPIGVLVVHGFTGSPQSMRPLAEAYAAAGHTVEMPRLPGHGTSVDDMATTSWSDWYGEAVGAYRDLASRTERVVAVGLSMGGTIVCRLAIDHPEIAGIVPINAAVEYDATTAATVQQMIEAGEDRMPGIGADIADPDQDELAYDQVPLECLRSLLGVVQEVEGRLSEIRCPVLVMVSPEDHVVQPSSSELLATKVSGPVRTVVLDRSYHVATLDYDQQKILDESLQFIDEISGA